MSKKPYTYFELADEKREVDKKLFGIIFCIEALNVEKNSLLTVRK